MEKENDGTIIGICLAASLIIGGLAILRKLSRGGVPNGQSDHAKSEQASSDPSGS